METSEKFFFSWSEAFQAGEEIVGGKGWNLGRLERYGFKIPAGGVLGAETYRIFIQENRLLDTIENTTQSVSISNHSEREVEEKLKVLREKVKAGYISSPIQKELLLKLKDIGILEKMLAVRSSASSEDSSGASFAGIHQSFLNVWGLDNILAAIKGCYASLWTPRAVAYRRKMNIKDDEVIPAVVIMEMVEANAAGVGFTCDPRTGREDVLVISANFGLGESVVSGAVEPDEYRLRRGYWPEITKKIIGRKEGITVTGKHGGTEFIRPDESMTGQVLSNENIVQLGFLIPRVFEALGNGEHHQDIEWVFDGQEFILVQARPVTALPRYTCPEIKEQPDIWSNANFRDSLPVVQSTLNWSLNKYGLSTILQSPFQSVGYSIPPGLKYVRFYQGRTYINLSLLQWLWYDALGLAPRKTNEIVGGHQPEIIINEKKPYTGIKGIKRLSRLLKFMLTISKTKRKAKKILSKYNDYIEDFHQKDLSTFTNEEDLYHILLANAKAAKEFAPSFLLLGTSSVTPYTMMVNTLAKNFPGQGNAMANAIMAGCADITSAEHGYRLMEMAEIARSDVDAQVFFNSEPFNPLLWDKHLPDNSPFKQSLRNFLDEYGHRCVYELEIMNSRWREDPSYLLYVIRNNIKTTNLGQIKTQQKEKTEKAWRAINQKLPFHRRMLVKFLLKQALRGAELREMSKSMLVKGHEPGRLIYQEIGRRLAVKGVIEKQGDIYHCALIEISAILRGYWDGKGLTNLVAERKARMKKMEVFAPPDLIIDETPHFAQPASPNSDNAFTGKGVAAGRASGAAKLVNHPDKGEKLQAGDVLVAPSTDPAWTPLFLRACAIVMETGGFSSHGSIVAREYGIPAVVNIPGVMKMIKDAQIITVDGDQGKVYL